MAKKSKKSKKDKAYGGGKMDFGAMMAEKKKGKKDGKKPHA